MGIHSRFLSTLLGVIGLTYAAVPAPAQVAIIGHEPKQQQLAPGKTAGTFAFSYSSTISFSQEPAYPAIVTIKATLDSKTPLASITVADGQPFTITADLPPGGYWVGADVAPDKQGLYWGSGMINVFIAPNGMASINDPMGRMLLQKKMTIIGPDKLVIVTDPRPVLKWQPLAGAAHYRLDWFVEKPGDRSRTGKSAQTDDTSFQMPENVVPGFRYQWSVSALGPNGGEIGYYSSASFFTPGGKEAFAKAYANARTIKAAGKGTPYVGISPRFDPQAEGIGVMNVMAGSPALAAGLQPQDVITSFNGKSLAGTSIRDFVELVRSQPVGSVITLDYLRGDEKKTAKVTVGAMP